MVSYNTYRNNYFSQTESIPTEDNGTTYYLYRFCNNKEGTKKPRVIRATMKKKEPKMIGRLGLFGKEMTWERSDSE